MNGIRLTLQLRHGPPKLVIVTHHPPWCRGRGLNVEVGQGSSPKVTAGLLTYDVALDKPVFLCVSHL